MYVIVYCEYADIVGSKDNLDNVHLEHFFPGPRTQMAMW